jgi:N-acetylglutamate synthase-like GNAT family acetyltransferase
MLDIRLRAARQTDQPIIKDLIRRVDINPFGLDWRHFIIAETTSADFAGCGQIKPHRDGSLELASIAVEVPQRGQGVARAIIDHLLANNPRPLYLTCRAELGPFYQKFGFRVLRPGDDASPFFRRLSILFRLAYFLFRQKGLIMRLDA